MTSDTPEEARQDFLDEFYAECDEQMASIGTLLNAIELEPAIAESERHLEALFRVLHTLKGNCGIVGIASAEHAAHAMESVIRAAVRREVTFSQRMCDALWQGTERMRLFLLAHRSSSPLPDLQDLAVEWEKLLSQSVQSPGASPQDPALQAASVAAASAAEGDPPPNVWTCYFAPTPALQESGISIGVVRQRLERLGPVLSCIPLVEPGKGLRFKLSVQLPTAPVDGDEWSTIGVCFDAPSRRPSSVLSPDPVLRSSVVTSDSELTPSHLVRVDLAHLDELMRITGDLLVQRFRLRDRLGELLRKDENLTQLDQSLGRSLRDLSSTIYRVRLVPIAEVFSRMPYVVRELGRGSANLVQLRFEGENTEIDKYLIERLREPLLHLVRNALAHAFEPPEARLQAGKPAQGTLLLRARHLGDAVEIRVSDDGRGIDPVQIAARAAELGLPAYDGSAGSGLLKILCEPGFSTQETPDRTAGRGVGMAIVARTMAELGGTLRLSTSPGSGSEFTLKLPLRLSIVDALIVSVAGQLCAIPETHVQQVRPLETEAIRRVNDCEYVPYQEALLPLIRMRDVFRADSAVSNKSTVLVILAEGGVYGLVVDAVLSRKEIVVSSFRDPLVRVPGVSGATELGDGRPVLVIAPEVLWADHSSNGGLLVLGPKLAGVREITA